MEVEEYGELEIDCKTVGGVAMTCPRFLTWPGLVAISRSFSSPIFSTP